MLSVRELEELIKEVERSGEKICGDICQLLQTPDEEKCNLFREIDRDVEDRLSRYGVAVLLAPTGTGKTTYLLLKALCANDKVMFFTSGKLMRSEILRRLLKLREVPRRVLVLFPKYMSCINDRAKKSIAERFGENVIPLYLFGCRKCEFNTFVSSNVIDKIEIKKIVTNLPGEVNRDITNLYEIGRKLGVCPFNLAREFLHRVDVVVMDHTYLIHKLLRELEALCEKSLVILDEVHVNYYSWRVHTTAFTTIKSVLRKLGLKDQVKVVEELEKKAVELAKKFSSYKEFGYVVLSQYDDQQVKLIIDEVIRIVKTHIRVEDLEKICGLKVTELPSELTEEKKRKPRYLGLITLKYVLEQNIPFEPFLVVDKEKCYIYYARKPYLKYPHKKLIMSSATITKIDIAASLRCSVSDVEKFVVVTKLPFERKTYIVNEDTTFERRDTIAARLVGVLDEVKPIVIANLSWLEKLKNIKHYYKVTDKLEDRLKVVEEVKQCLGKEPVLLSPYTSYAWGLDLVNYDEPIELNVIAFENAPKKCVENDVIVKFYTVNLMKYFELRRSRFRLSRDVNSITKYATIMTMIKKGVCYTLQALGRFQRNHKLHKLNVVFIGKHMKFMLELFMYSKMFDRPREITLERIVDVLRPRTQSPLTASHPP